MKICVFCSSSDSLEPFYYDAARQLGEYIGSGGHTLVYGGSEKGLMKECAKAVKQNGGKITGIAPSFVVDHGLLNPDCDQVIKVVDLAERKRTMIQESDAFIALPGGIGTLDEIFSTAACNVVRECSKPIFVLNLGGCFDPLETLLENLTAAKFINPKRPGNITFCRTTEQIIQELTQTGK